MHHSSELLNLLAEPFKPLFGDAIMLRVTDFDVGLFELLEPRSIPAGVVGPDISQAWINPLRLSAKSA